MAEIKIKGDISGSTTIKAPDSGSDEVIELSTVLDGKAPLDSPTFTGTPALPDGTTLAGAALTSGKILQVVRATDATQRTTTSTSYVDANLSVTITPQKSDSVILIIYNGLVQTPQTGAYTTLRIADSSDNPISGAENAFIRDANISDIRVATTLIAYATPATTSPVTYKLRFLVSSGTGTLQNSQNTGQLYAIEVAA